MAPPDGAGPTGADGEPFVGRAAELARLADCLAALPAGGRAALVEGEAGVGKSTLLRYLLASLSPDAAGGPTDSAAPTVVQATALPDDQHVPFGIIEQLAPAPAAALRPGPDRDPLRAGAALIECLAERAGCSGGVILVVEDVQWADRTSLQALSFALRRLRADPVIALISSRPPADEAITRLVAATGGPHLTLAPLDVAEVQVLAEKVGAGRLAPAAAQRLWEHTSGLPLHVRAMCAELDADQLGRLDRPLPAPRSYALLVAAQVAALPPDTAALVGAVAVLGGRSTLGRAQEVAAVDDVSRSLGPAVEAGLLESPPGSVGGDVRARHPLVTAAVVQHMSPVERRDLHLRAARTGSPGEALLHRAAAALGPDPDLARETEQHARDLLSDHRVGAAARALLRAARLTPIAEGRDQLHLEAVSLLLADGDVAAAAGHEDDVAAMAPSGPQQLVRGQLALLSGRQAEAVEHLEQAWRLRPPGPSATTAGVATSRGHLALLQAQASEAAEWGRRAWEAAPDDRARSEAAALRAIAHGMLGDGQGLAQVAATPDQAQRPEHLDGLLARGIVRLWSGDPRGADDALAQVTDGTLPWRPLRVRLSALGCRAKAGYRLGRFAASRTHADLAVSLARDAEHIWALSFLCSVAALVPAVQGDWAEAEDHVAAAARAAVAGGGLATDRVYAAHAAAHLAFARGQPGGVVDAIQPVFGLLRRDGYAEPGVMPWRELYAAALADLGCHEEADRVGREVEAAAARRGHDLASASALRLRGHLLAAAGDHETAVRRFDDALGALDGAEATFERALVHDARGRALRRHGRRRDAAAALGAALDAYQDLRAAPFTARAEVEAAACGLTPRPRDPTRRVDLTPQEQAVAARAARGDTNREIAAELVVSVKTVEYHLSNIFTKVGVRSRRDLRHLDLDA